jgi:hypothetical protein
VRHGFVLLCGRAEFVRDLWQGAGQPPQWGALVAEQREKVVVQKLRAEVQSRMG